LPPSHLYISNVDRKLHKYTKDSNKYDIWATVKSTNTGAGTGNFYKKKLLGCTLETTI
jgi:hypothetical protein